VWFSVPHLQRIGDFLVILSTYPPVDRVGRSAVPRSDPTGKNAAGVPVSWERNCRPKDIQADRLKDHLRVPLRKRPGYSHVPFRPPFSELRLERRVGLAYAQVGIHLVRGRLAESCATVTGLPLFRHFRKLYSQRFAMTEFSEGEYPKREDYLLLALLRRRSR
jgi:hypothetical protein